MRRRTFIAALGALGGTTLGATGCSLVAEDGLRNPCLDAELPPALARDETVQAAFDGLDTSRVWDCHAHLLGIGDSGGVSCARSRAWVR